MMLGTIDVLAMWTDTTGIAEESKRETTFCHLHHGDIRLD